MSDSKADQKMISTGSVVRIPHYDTAGGYRLYLVTATRLGGTGQESVYEIYPLDVDNAKRMEVPCVLLDTHPKLQLPNSQAFYEDVVNPKVTVTFYEDAINAKVTAPSYITTPSQWTIKS